MSKEQQAKRPEGMESEVAIRGTNGQPAGLPGRGQEPIPVKMLRFRAGETVDIPGKQGAMAIGTSPEDTPKGHKRWAVDYLPWTRHHRVTFYDAGATAAVVMHIHEVGCAWEPM